MDVGIGMPELGHIKLSDLASIVGPNKQPVARDLYFQAVRPLSEYLRLSAWLAVHFCLHYESCIAPRR